MRQNLATATLVLSALACPTILKADCLSTCLRIAQQGHDFAVALAVATFDSKIAQDQAAADACKADDNAQHTACLNVGLAYCSAFSSDPPTIQQCLAAYDAGICAPASAARQAVCTSAQTDSDKLAQAEKSAAIGRADATQGTSNDTCYGACQSCPDWASPENCDGIWVCAAHCPDGTQCKTTCNSTPCGDVCMDCFTCSPGLTFLGCSNGSPICTGTPIILDPFDEGFHLTGIAGGVRFRSVPNGLLTKCRGRTPPGRTGGLFLTATAMA